MDKKIGTFHHYHTRNHSKEKKVAGKKKRTLTVPFVVDDIPPEHKFPGLALIHLVQMLSVLNKYMFLV